MKRTALVEVHRSLGAKMVEFAGWEMPLKYSNITEEHMAVRRALGLFDVSHMGKVLITGEGAARFISRIQTNLPPEPGRNTYGHILNEEGIILDDTIISCTGRGEYLCIPNASTRGTVLDWFRSHAGGGVTLTDRTEEMFCIALQGPGTEEFLRKEMGLDVRGMRSMSVRKVSLTGEDILLSRSGYTGEDGVELVGPDAAAERLFTTLLERGEPYGCRACGLGARDTLRLEKGLLLSGQDFNMDRTPLETNCSWVVKWEHEFIGREALRKFRVRERLRGVRMRSSRDIPRHGAGVYQEGERVGTVTSGSYSPCLGVGIGLAYLSNGVKGEVTVDVRGTRGTGDIVRPPFV